MSGAAFDVVMMVIFISALACVACLVAAYCHHWPAWLDPFDRP